MFKRTGKHKRGILETKQNNGCQGLGGGEMESYCLMDIEFQFYKMQRAMDMDGGDGCTFRMYLISLNCILKSG